MQAHELLTKALASWCHDCKQPLTGDRYMIIDQEITWFLCAKCQEKAIIKHNASI